AQILPTEFAVGKRWTTRFKIRTQKGDGEVELELRIVTRESITVAAGTFDTYRIEADGWTVGSWSGSVHTQRKMWIAPGTGGRAMAWGELGKRDGIQSKVPAREGGELVSNKQIGS